MRGEDTIRTPSVSCSPETPPHAWGRPAKLYRIRFALETPPHAWGRPKVIDGADDSIRNTPTCVGKTPALACSQSAAWKHPHMRGEDQNGEEQRQTFVETPPHAWGRHQHIVNIIKIKATSSVTY